MMVPADSAQGAARGAIAAAAADGALPREAWLTFRLGGARYALALASVEAVLPGDQPMLPIPGHFPLAGAFLHRERPTPVLDLAARLGCTPEVAPAQAIMIVVGSGGSRRAFRADMLCSVERVARQPLRSDTRARQLPGATIRCRAAQTWEVLGDEAFALA